MSRVSSNVGSWIVIPYRVQWKSAGLGAAAKAVFELWEPVLSARCGDVNFLRPGVSWCLSGPHLAIYLKRINERRVMNVGVTYF